ncbi:MAG TPA: FtsX-like permease family protein, partial [Anaerolineales bacterium]|nr:FtsX-like permease family protein [Anaerolineales bacterium]
MNLQFTLAARYLTGRKLRTVLTTLAIMFGVLLIFGMNTLMPASVEAFQVSALALSGQVDATITNKAGATFPVGILDQVRGVEGVRVASGTLRRPVNLPADFLDNDPSAPDRIGAVSLVGAIPEDIRSLVSYNVLEGRFLEDNDPASAVITQSLAEQAGVSLGDSLSLPSPTGVVELAIVGILPQRLLPGNEEVLITLSEAQRIFDSPGRINSIDANFDTVEDDRRAQIQASIESMLGESYTIGVLQPGAEILTNIRTGQTILNLLGIMGLLMGGFIIFNTFRTVIAERRRDIGMLRAVGARRRTITGLILTEGIIQGVVGTAAGILLGYLFGLLAISFFAPIGRQFLNVEVGSPALTPGLFLISILLGVGVTLVAGLAPARAASRITPLEALRPSAADVTLRRMAGLSLWIGIGLIVVSMLALFTGQTGFITIGSVLFVIGLILIAPALVNPIARFFGKLIALIFARHGTAQLAEGNLSRQPSRAAVTASTTLIAIAVVVMAATILSSITISFTNMLEKSLSSDFLLIPPSIAVWGTNVGASPDLAGEIRDIEGVDVVSSLRFAGSQINGVATSLLGIVPEDYVKTSGLTFAEGDPETAFREMESGKGMIINGVMATAAGLDVGDEV